MKTKKNSKIKTINIKNKMSRKNKEINEENKKKGKCSPNPNGEKYTCYSSKSLLKMKKLWNKRHPNNRIQSNDPKKIWSAFKSNLKNVCNRESCWLRAKFMEGNLDSELINFTFAPSVPESWKKNPNEWLNSMDIESVMKQYERFYKCFEFLGPSPIDFDAHKMYGECVWEELCKFELEEMIKRGKNKIGIIFNTHPHTFPGEHWIALFINIKKKQIIYFDSNGNKVPKEIEKLIEKIKGQGKALNIDFNVFNNKVKHQKTDSECGMYCLYFIIQMLKDKDIKYFLENNIDDEEVFRLRNNYFN
jgi:hypothetical protein